MEIFSEYEHAEYRYVLGNIQDKKAKTIIYLGLNPSYATSHKHDKTTSFITRWATTQKYENVIFLNICPFVCTYGKDLLLELNSSEVEINYNNILTIIKQICPFNNYTILCAWGNDINGREYLKDTRDKILNLFSADERKNNFKCFGLTKKGNPKQIRCLKIDESLIDFQI